METKIRRGAMFDAELNNAFDDLCETKCLQETALLRCMITKFVAAQEFQSKLAMDFLEQLVVKKATQRTGKPLTHATADVIKSDSVDSHSVDVIKHVGLNAASFFNIYSCKVEDALIELALKCKGNKDDVVQLYQEVLRLRYLVPQKVIWNMMHRVCANSYPLLCFLYRH